MSDLFGRPGVTDWDLAERLLDGALSDFSLAERSFDLLGYDTAAADLRRYRSRRGGLEEYSDAEIARHPALLDAEDANRTRFEAFTFTGRTKKPELNADLLDLPDGGTRRFGDDWDLAIPWRRPSTYLAFGGTSVTSRGEFTAHRSGDAATIRGIVGHGFGLKEIFDFNPGQPGSHSAAMLEAADEAARFQMAYDRHQDVEAELRYEPDGSLTLRGVTWGTIR